jgi:signal transduction histidine kinase
LNLKFEDRRGDIMERLEREADEKVSVADGRSEFLALLSHELRNSVAPITCAVQILRTAPDADAGRQDRLLSMVERNLSHMVRMLDDLLDVSRIGHGTIELCKEQLDVAQVVQVGVEASQPLIDSMGHQLSLSLLPYPVLLNADRIRLAQIVSILLNNAAQHSTPGCRIHLSIECTGSELRFSVADGGTGIRREDVNKIFDPFVKLGRSSVRPGLGIGLTLVRTLVALHGGRIDAHSAGPGHGSEFVVSLPGAVRCLQGPPPQTTERETAAEALRA